MKHGNTTRVRFPISAVLATGVLVGAMFVVACGGHSSLPSQNVQELAPQRQCTGGTQTIGIQPAAMHPLPVIGQCSPPPQWDIMVTNPGNNTATSYQFTTTGNATPTATMGPSNHLSGDYAIYYDGDTLSFFMADASGAYANTVNSYYLTCLNSGGSSSGCPYATMSGSNTNLNQPMALTENYNVTVDGDEPAYTLNVGGTPAVIAQLENAAGNPTPLYQIKGSNTGMGNGAGLAVDSDVSSPSFGGIYVDDVSTPKVMMWLPSKQFPNPTSNQILNIAPYKTISGTNTGITDPVGMYVDIDGYLYVVNQSTNKVLVFSPSQSGNVAPVNTITTGLNKPYGVAVDGNLNVWVTNDGDNSLRSFTNGHSGSSVKSTISGSNTGLNSPANLDVKISR